MIKLKFYFVTITLLISVIFSACKTDDVIVNPGNNYKDYFDWSVQDVYFTSVKRISLGSPNNLFIAANASYKLSNGVVSSIDFGDPYFRVQDVKAFDSTYAIFWGDDSRTYKSVFKIYNNGTIQSYEVPIYSSLDINIIHIIEKGKFMAFCDGSSGYYLFKNGEFILRNKPNPGIATLIGKSNNENYLFLTDYSPFTYHNIYKFSGDTLLHVKTEVNKTNSFATATTIMREEFFAPYQRFTYFNGFDWNTTLTYNENRNLNYSVYFYNTGESNNFFVNLTSDSTGYFKSKVWDGEIFSPQSNFPANIPGSYFPYSQTISEYIGGTFYFYCKNSSNSAGRLIKGVRRN